MNKTIKHTFFYPHSVDLVWDYLTKPELIKQWLMENNFQPVVGYQFQFQAKPKVKINFDGNIYCEVLEIVPYQRLTYSWKGGGTKEKPTLDSVVTWSLLSKNDGTELTLEHSGFKGLKNYPAYFIMNMGWLKIGKRFLKNLNP